MPVTLSLPNPYERVDDSRWGPLLTDLSTVLLAAIHAGRPEDDWDVATALLEAEVGQQSLHIGVGLGLRPLTVSGSTNHPFVAVTPTSEQMERLSLLGQAFAIDLERQGLPMWDGLTVDLRRPSGGSVRRTVSQEVSVRMKPYFANDPAWAESSQSYDQWRASLGGRFVVTPSTLAVLHDSMTLDALSDSPELVAGDREVIDRRWLGRVATIVDAGLEKAGIRWAEVIVTLDRSDSENPGIHTVIARPRSLAAHQVQLSGGYLGLVADALASWDHDLVEQGMETWPAVALLVHPDLSFDHVVMTDTDQTVLPHFAAEPAAWAALMIDQLAQQSRSRV